VSVDRKVPVWVKLSMGLMVGLLVVQALPRQNVITINLTESSPIGIYIRAAETSAEYVTLCLRQDHAVFAFYEGICHPGAMEEGRLIKRISERRDDGTLIVEGIGPLAIDSDLLGPVLPTQIDRWWNPLLTLRGSTHD